MKPYILGVAGGSGSGKTYFARALREKLGELNCEILYQDNFYFDQSQNFDFDGGSVNFDHPDSIDGDYLAACLESLKAGKITEIPLYDFHSHSRLQESLSMPPRPVIIVDGILIFHFEKARGLFDDLIFFDTPEELRYQRRLHRDVEERGRSPDGIFNQFFRQVKPMHDQFVEPSKSFAHAIVRDVGDFELALQNYFKKLSRLLPR